MKQIVNSWDPNMPPIADEAEIKRLNEIMSKVQNASMVMGKIFDGSFNPQSGIEKTLRNTRGLEASDFVLLARKG